MAKNFSTAYVSAAFNTLRTDGIGAKCPEGMEGFNLSIRDMTEQEFREAYVNEYNFETPPPSPKGMG